MSIDVYDELAKLLPDSRYMDPPDGGSVDALEQVKRMIADLKAQRDELLSAMQRYLPFIPTSSASNAGASRFSENVLAADNFRAAIAKCEQK